MLPQFATYTQNPLLLLLQPGLPGVQAPGTSGKSEQQQQLPLSLYEPTLGLGTNRTMLIKVEYKVETGEAERIAVDWTAKGGEGGGSCTCDLSFLSFSSSRSTFNSFPLPCSCPSVISHLQSQRAATQMLHARIGIIISYVENLIKGSEGTKLDYPTLRTIQSLVASLPASEHKTFREEYEQEYADVQLTAYLSTLTKTANVLNDVSPLPPW